MGKRLSEEEITQLRTRIAKKIQRRKTPVALPPGRKLARGILFDGEIFMVALLIVTLFPVRVWFAMSYYSFPERNTGLLTIGSTAIVLFFVFRWIRKRLYTRKSTVRAGITTPLECRKDCIWSGGAGQKTTYATGAITPDKSLSRGTLNTPSTDCGGFI